MKIIYTARFQRDYATAPASVRKAFDKQLQFLSHDLQHPSLHAKKYSESTRLWQARVNRSWRFYFTIEGDAYVLHTIIAHPK